MAQKLIIDGYNVIYTDEVLRRTACRDLERARTMLVERLKSYLSGRGLQMTVVFDGRGGMTDAEAIIPGKLQVMYSARSQTADEVIISTLRDSTNPSAYIVVTSDMADIGRTARSLGCEVIGSKRFLERLGGGDRRPAQPGPARPGAGRPPDSAPEGMGDTDYWLDKFAGSDDSEEK